MFFKPVSTVLELHDSTYNLTRFKYHNFKICNVKLFIEQIIIVWNSKPPI